VKGIIVLAAAGFAGLAGAMSASRDRGVERGTPVPPIEREKPPTGAGIGVEVANPGAPAPVLPFHVDWTRVRHEDAVVRGLGWLAAAQGPDGGWGQDGGHAEDPRKGVSLETQGNDVANTALTALAFLRSGSTPSEGPYRDVVAKAVKFVLASVEAAPADGPQVTDRQGTQIQRKLGRYVDTYVAAMVLAQVEARMPDEAGTARVRAALAKCVAKIGAGQQADGSWNVDGWAPLLSTSFASQGLAQAKESGADVDLAVMDRAEEFTAKNLRGEAQPAAAPASVGVGGFESAPGRPTSASFAVDGPADIGVGGAAGGSFRFRGSAGVELYGLAQAAEEVSRTPERRAAYGKVLEDMARRVEDPALLSGFGSMGGEEFVSYLNISQALARSGGPTWTKWNGRIGERLRRLQNQDGTWAGHHCITGRVACTGAAVLTLLQERTLAKAD